jgi:glycosyltransferase involved in cell wall biosynthesis
MKLLYVVTHPITAEKKLTDQMEFMRERGTQVSIVSCFDEDQKKMFSDEVQVFAVPFSREISLWRDIVSLYKTFWIVRGLQPDIVNASTPKAGLIGMIAAWLNRVPCRIYVLRGLRHETLRGPKMWIMKSMERISAFCSTRVVAVSHSLRTAMIHDRVCNESKILVLGDGSSNGLDAEKFDPKDEKTEIRRRVRDNLKIPQSDPVAVFVGRFTRDKGIAELVEAFELVLQSSPNAWLVLVGDYESGDPVPDTTKTRIAENSRILLVPFSPPKDYLVAADVFVFPSFREGFPVAPLEAAAAGLPTVGFACTGTVDAVIDGVTGLLVPVGDAKRFAESTVTYFQNESLRIQHAHAAKKRVLESFSQQTVWDNLVELYRSELSKVSVK